MAQPPHAPVVAIGNFDGVHRGHQRLFAEARRRAAALGGESVALTFEPHPARVLAPERAPALISTPRRKLELIEGCGIALCVVETFDRALAALSPEEFVDEVLVRALGARAVCVGWDFTFGKARRGDAATLRALGAERGFEVAVIEPVAIDGVVCSSSKVRELVRAGRVEEAARLLGRDVEAEGEVVRGAGRGRGIGVPTANLRAETELLPGGGVYAGWVQLLDEGSGGVIHDAAINVGTNPTFTDAATVHVEAHLLDWDGGDLYGRRVRFGFVERLRDELRFSSVEALVEQIRRDVEAAHAVAARRRPRGAP